MVKPASQRARHANQHLHPHHIRRKTAAVAVAACFTTGVAIANPTAPTVVHGTVSMSQAGGILNITNSHNAIINWGSFSIGAGELTRFIQPSALSAVLNRVVGSDPSAILGALQSNGRVFLLNPNGIVFGSGAQINVAGLVASTLNLSNDDFLNNRMRFTDGAGAGSVVNQGNITGGSVYLIGNAVANKGLITSPNGEVVLAAGNSVELVSPGTPNLRVEVVAPANEAVNLGSISAEAGRVGIYAGLVKQGGSINADSAVAEGGRILLKSTKSTVLEAGSVTTARGTSGGQIVALSGMTDGKTEVAGKLDASAIASGAPGAGGFIETSAAKVKIADSAVINAAGSNGGKAGTWLIDPTDFYISNAYGGDMSATFLSSTLNSYGSGTNVDIESTGGAGGSTGTIFVNDAVTWSTDSTLRLVAVGNVEVNSAITNTGNGAVKLYAGWDGVSYGSSDPVVGFTPAPLQNIVLNAPISTGGDIHLVAYGNITQGGPGSLTANNLLASSQWGSVNLANASATNTVSTIAGNAKGQFAFKNNGDLTIGSVGGVNGISAYGASPGLHVTVDVDVTGGALTVANQIVAVGADGSEGQAGGNANISLMASNGITVNANITASAGHGGFSYGAPGTGGMASVNLTSTGSPVSDLVISSGVTVQAIGGGGGDAYGSTPAARGGDATASLNSTGVITVEGQVMVSGGHGGTGSSAIGGRGGDATITASAAGGINHHGFFTAYGGSGTNGGNGGNAAIQLTATGGTGLRLDGGEVYASGGSAGYSDNSNGGIGGNAEVRLISSSGIMIDGGEFYSVQARGGAGGYVSSGAFNGGAGGSGTVLIQNTSATDGVSINQNVTADGGEGGYGRGLGAIGGRGGDATVTVTSSSNIDIHDYGYLSAQGGSGGYGNSTYAGEFSTPFSDPSAQGGRGGNASISLTAAGGITVAGFQGINARGGSGGYGAYNWGYTGSSGSGYWQTNSGTGGRGGDATATLQAGNGIIFSDNTYLSVRAGDGGGYNTGTPEIYGNGGTASATLNNTGGAPIALTSTQGINVEGGEGTIGGDASVVMNSAGGVTISGGSFYVEAYGGDGVNGGASRGGAASIQLTSTNPSLGVLIDGGEVYANGGYGGYNNAGLGGQGGDASVSITSSSGILVNEFVGARGGSGGGYSGSFARGNGGNANTTLTNTGTVVPIALTNGSVVAEGGEGLIAGNATLAMTSAAGFDVTNGYIFSSGGAGYASPSFAAQGGTASLVLTNTNAGMAMQFANSTIVAVGGTINRGGAGSGNGGDAVTILSSAGGITLANSLAGAVGGNVSGSGGGADQGGAGALTMLAGGNILIEGAEGNAWGGSGPVGGSAAINVIAGGNIQIEGGEAAAGFATFSLPGAASSVVVAAAGNLTMTDAHVYSAGMTGLGGANILLESSSVSGGAGVQVDASGSLTVTNAAVYSPGMAYVTTGGNVLVENSGLIAGYPDVVLSVGGEIFMNTGGQIHAGMPSTIYLTFPMLESGGFTVNGVPGLVFDGSTGFFAGGSDAVLGTNLLITYGGGAVAELQVPTETLIVAMNESIKPPDAEKKKDIFEDENQAKKKKEAPVCR